MTKIAILAPLLGAILTGIFGHQVGIKGAHRITITGVAVTLLMSCMLAYEVLFLQADGLSHTYYSWLNGGRFFTFNLQIGCLLDPLTVIMMCTVSFVSLLVHIYSIGYMENNPGYQRFFSYISLFTFTMLLLITANNFLQLFIGWEGVGFASYLLIGFWFKKESAVQGNLKAFLVNRVGDFGFLLGIGVIFAYVQSLDYVDLFSHLLVLNTQSIQLLGFEVSVITLICILLFIGAMGKSAQVPLHIWLPESMEGPTPISALIHAATMVTSGVFMVARMSPLYELSEFALSFILIIGATGAFFTGLIAIVMNDIKRVLAYSTLSQLGYMIAALGVSAYSVGILHLITHAFFKALLFLGAGSVIIAMHHEQDMRKMGGLIRYIPITYATYLIGTLALCAIPPFAGFYSKDIIIAVIDRSQIFGTTYAYYCALLGTFVTAFYSFRSLFMTFHGETRMDSHIKHGLKESSWVVWLPLILLAIPSVIGGYLLLDPMLFDSETWLQSSIYTSDSHPAFSELAKDYHGSLQQIFHAFISVVFWLTLLGIGFAWLGYVKQPELPSLISSKFSFLHRTLINKFGFDDFNEKLFISGSKKIGRILSGIADTKIIDNTLVDGTSQLIRKTAYMSRVIQSGYLNHYIGYMMVGLLGIILWLLFG